MKKTLIIDESDKFREYLARKLEEQNIEVVIAKNGLEGATKIRSELPDLIVMDYYLSRKSALEIMQEKVKNPNTIKTPIILISSKVDSTKVVELVKYGVKKIFSKPIKIDAVLTAVSKLLNVTITLDNTPSIIEAHINDNILFIEVAQGLNIEKIELLKYKIPELLDVHDLSKPKVLLMMTSLDLAEDDRYKLTALLETVIQSVSVKKRNVKVLSKSDFVRKHIEFEKSFSGVELYGDIGKAMDALLGQSDADSDQMKQEKLLSSSKPVKDKKELIHMRFEKEKLKQDFSGEEREKIAIIDDDFVIRELVKAVFEDSPWRICDFASGGEFLDSCKKNDFQLIFLDLVMPEMNGFQVITEMKKAKIETPVVIFSALSQKETVIKAMQSGIHSYMIKPLKPINLVKKAAALLQREF